MSEYICEFCNKNFKTNNTLKQHQKNTKYCLEIQKDKNKEFEDKLKECYYCHKKFSTNAFKRHLDTCKSKNESIIVLEEENKKLKDENNKLKDENKRLKDENNKLNKNVNYKENIISSLNGEIRVYKDEHKIIMDIAKQPKTTNNNKIMNITTSLDFNDTNKIKSVLENNYNLEYFLEGQKGIAEFAVKNLLKDKNGELIYICTDPSRQIFKYKDNDGDIKKDVEAKKLTEYLVDGGLNKRVIDISNNWFLDINGNIDLEKFQIVSEKQQNMLKLKDDNNIFKKELVSQTTL